uniref:TolC family protein n=1 Tax=Halobacteriovorax sp. TaxID=2020862 RepID=UPI0035680E9C
MRKNSLFVTLVMLMTSSVSAEIVNLNEKKVIEMALERNESMGISQAEIEIAQSKIDASVSNLFPTFSLQAQIRKSSGKGSVLPYGYQWNESGSVGITQPLYTFGRISSGIDIAKASKEI